MDCFVEESIKIRYSRKVGDGKVLCAPSGGVDSSVAAVMYQKPVGNQLTCVFVDHGLLRKNEGDEVKGVFGENGSVRPKLHPCQCTGRYYEKLKGVTEPEAKRKIIGEEFIRIFEEEAKKNRCSRLLAQGTIYPDVVESGLGGESAVIKSHHNVGGLPDYVDFKEIIEPLRDLFKDEVRKAGLELGIPEYWYSVSHSQDQDWESVSSVKSPLRKKLKSSRMPTQSSEKKLPKQESITKSTSTLPH